MKAYRMKIKDLDYYQRCEFFRRTEPMTPDALSLRANFPIDELTLYDAFRYAGKTNHSAKIQSFWVREHAVFRYYRLIDPNQFSKVIKHLMINATENQEDHLHKHKMQMVYKYNLDASVLYWQEYTKSGKEINR